MFRSSGGGGDPTMIIPRGTQVDVDSFGQLSIRTPGNLVIQNSGSYATLESVSGSIRIEADIDVEAVTVRCAETCYVQGNLTAWRLIARSLHLAGEATAHVVLQETEKLEVAGDARLVGNFQDRRELYDLFSRFTRQLRNVPLGTGGSSAEGTVADASRSLEAEVEPPVSDEAPLPQELFFARVLLERESERSAHGPSSRRVLSELVKLLDRGEAEALMHTYRTLFSRIAEPSEDLRRAQKLIASFFTDRRPADEGEI